ncbi:hypothetical protein NC651_019328 [Populus alba x Populus x berolinensis]|nr:hypothetical protein NC651_019328 [Populus alba x Populus x berolinensis]
MDQMFANQHVGRNSTPWPYSKVRNFQCLQWLQMEQSHCLLQLSKGRRTHLLLSKVGKNFPSQPSLHTIGGRVILPEMARVVLQNPNEEKSSGKTFKNNRNRGRSQSGHQKSYFQLHGEWKRESLSFF